FSIDRNGIVNVSAKDKGTGNEQKITITASTNMSEEEINQRVKEAEQFAEEDKKRKEEAEVTNQADSLVYEMEKQLRENGDKLGEEDKATVQSELEAFKKVKETGDVQKIKDAIEPMTQKVYAIFGKLYQQTPEGAPQGGPDMGQSGPVENDDGTVNTDFDVE
ncbi:MAG TPA: Hsp70 family protein, partial [Candidatus Limiplasma sp.]|nr:Hsp70 family protein [Candidatus Limiplasma sp.]